MESGIIKCLSKENELSKLEISRGFEEIKDLVPRKKSELFDWPRLRLNIIKNQILWTQFVESECANYFLTGSGQLKIVTELNCIKENYNIRILKINELKSLIIDAKALD